MILDKFEPLTYMDIWEPKWYGLDGKGHREAWLSLTKVKHAKTRYIKIRFTKTKAEEFQGDWVISKAKAMTFPKGSNGIIPVYRVPFEELEPLEISEHSIHEIS